MRDLLKTGVAVVSLAALSAGAFAAPGPLVNFDSGADEDVLWFVRDGGHHGNAGGRVGNGVQVRPERRGVETRPAERGDRRFPVNPGTGWRGGERHEFHRPAPQHWGFHPAQRPWRWHGSWIRWWGWTTIWVAGAGMGTCNAYYHSRLSGCFGSCYEEAQACGASYPGAGECSANYGYCTNSCQVEFASNYWAVCRIWVPPVPPLIADEPLPPGVNIPPDIYPDGFPYESRVPEPPAYQ